MHRLFDLLRPLIRTVVRRAWLVVGVAFVLSVVGLYFATHLRIDTDFAKLLPPDRESVEALNKVRSTLGGGSNTAAVAVTSPSFEANKRFAQDFIAKALKLGSGDRGEPYFTRAQLRRETDFMRNNALYFATSEELDQVKNFLQTEIKEAKQEANPFYFSLDEEEEEAEAKSDSLAREIQATYDQLVGTEYEVSEDSTTLVFRLFPSGMLTDVGYLEQAYEDMEALAERLQPSTYHPEMSVTFAGRLYRRLSEIQAITEDVLSSFGAGVTTVLLIVMLYFLYKAHRARTGGRFSSRNILSQELLRAPVMAFLIGLPLLMSLAWTYGVTYLAFDTLNLMTSTLGLVLFGLGIDFGIHFFARYSEERGMARSIAEAAETTFLSTGQAITIGALTTASALYVLTVADFRGFSEFGFTAGTGVVFALLAMTIVLPALLSIFERTGLLDLEAAPSMPAETSSPSRSRFPGARGVLIGSGVAVAVALFLLPSIGFEYRFGILEPEYEQYERRQDVVRRAESGDRANNPAYVVVDERKDVPAVKQALQRKMRQDTLSPTIEQVESLQDRFPLDTARQRNKLEQVAEIRALLESKYLKNEDSRALQRLRRAAQTRSPISTKQVPDYIKKPFMSKSGEVGNFVIIYPSVGLSDGRNSIAFLEDVGTITTADGETYHAASSSLVAADMLRLMRKEAPWMVAGTLLIVMLLMYVNFRSFRWAGLALLPLVVGLLWMFLLMEVLSLRLNFYNLVVLPAVLGIGNDAGVHIVHRYREEGAGSLMAVLRSTGEHVTMGSLTTMVGFGGLLLSFHPGLRSIGLLAVIGIGTTLLAALLFLPALLQWMEGDENVSEPQDEAAPARMPESAQV